MSIKTKLMTACAGVLLVGGIGASVANAGLVVDIRQLGTNAKEIMPTAADLGKPITLGVFARVTGAPGKAAIETLASVQGSFVSVGATHGAFAGANSFIKTDPDTGEEQTVGPIPQFGTSDVCNFYGNGALLPPKPVDPADPTGPKLPPQSTGIQQAIIGDGDMDFGGKPGDPVDNWVVFRTDTKNLGYKATNPAGLQGKTLGEGGVEFQIGLITFTPTAFGGNNTALDFFPRTEADGKIKKEGFVWTEDGTGAASLRDGSFASSISSSPFTILAIPEPATLSLFGLGAAMLLGRRNRR